MSDARSHGVTEAGAEAAVGTGVEPATRLVGLDQPPGPRHEVAAVSDYHRIAVELLGQLAVDPGRVHRVAVGLDPLPFVLARRVLLVAQLGDPRLVIGAVAAPRGHAV